MSKRSKRAHRRRSGAAIKKSAPPPQLVARVAPHPLDRGDERKLLGLLMLPVLLVALAISTGQSRRDAWRLPPLLEAALPPMPALPGPRELEQAVAAVRLELPIRLALPVVPEPRPSPARETAVWPRLALPATPPHIEGPAASSAQVPSVAMLGTPGVPGSASPPAAAAPPSESDDSAGVCQRRPEPARSARLAAPSIEEFGQRLAEAARSQNADLTIYTARYQRISYPMGDIPQMYGACTDVIIRAYRALGVDLQALVQNARIGSGDASIDHRRTETLRLFFARHGQSIPVSEFPEDYKPGDIVTYFRPFSRVSQSHIAIVSDVLGPSRRPMIIHNRGWGVQLEDALFVDRITGHYRYNGTDRPESAGQDVSKRIPGRPRSLSTQRVSQGASSGSEVR